MLVCLQSLPSIQSPTINVYLFFVNTMIQGIFSFLCLTNKLLIKKKKNFIVTDFGTCLPYIDIGVNDAGGQGQMRCEYTTVPVRLLSMSITQYGCHPVVGLCKYFT